MPNVDFTKAEILEDLRMLVREEVRAGTDEVKQALRGEFMNFVENNFQPAVDSLQEQITEVKQRKW